MEKAHFGYLFPRCSSFGPRFMSLFNWPCWMYLTTRKILRTRERLEPPGGFVWVWERKTFGEIEDWYLKWLKTASAHSNKKALKRIFLMYKIFWLRWTWTTRVFCCHTFRWVYFKLWCCDHMGSAQDFILLKESLSFLQRVAVLCFNQATVLQSLQTAEWPNCVLDWMEQNLQPFVE